MVFTSEARPSDSPLVEKVYRARTVQRGVFISTAASNWEMVITRYQGRTSLTVRGPETKATSADVPPDAEMVGIIFKLGAFMPHLPVRTLRDRNDLTLPEATNQSFWLLGMAWRLPDYENADTFANRLIREGLLAQDPVVDAALKGQPQDLTRRAVQHHFVVATGLTHNTIRQIERAYRAETLLQQGISILDTVYELGYSDQPHLTRSLRRFLGRTPAQIARGQQPIK